MATTYPNELPIAECFEIVSIIRNGELGAKKAKFAYNVWLLQGFAQKTTIGDPNVQQEEIQVLSVSPELNVAAQLEKICKAHETNNFEAFVTVPWKQILQWALTELTTIILAA